ncbi:hypothetical protein [Halovivax cerinus]|uniref:DUF2306 domain-containing protein n=1 Tax=Halovivax cerinus TaxID=1487865 RepID=A0ABD5NQK9_9EURY|nr:hypothetical protein [Halovivax cerinus]
MATLEDWTLWLHIAAGAIAVLAGVVALGTTKGGRRHRRVGRLFVYSMGVVVITVVGLAAIAPTRRRVVLTLVAIFSGYFAFSGYRVLARKRPTTDAAAPDRIATGTVFVACLGLALWGLRQYIAGTTFGIVMVVFGAIGVVFTVLDAREFRRDGATEWRVTHLQRMIAAFIATVSAVSAVNLTPVIGIAAWLWPTAVGAPLIAYWSATVESR